ncbi:hypothetical protein D3C72_1812300 [compost metagenome]
MIDADPQSIWQTVDHEAGAEHANPCQTTVDDEGAFGLSRNGKDGLAAQQFNLAQVGGIVHVQVGISIEHQFGAVTQLLHLPFADVGL